jgi:hypothetical protein
VTNQAGYNTGFSIANVSVFPGSSVLLNGVCMLSLYGTPKATQVTTPAVAAGHSYVNMMSSVAPGFQGYMVAECPFPARGFAFITDGYGVQGRGISQGYVAEVLSTERLQAEALRLYRTLVAKLIAKPQS